MALIRQQPRRTAERTVETVVETSPVTTSRSIRPPVTVPNRRLPEQGFGEGYLVYRCGGCGAVGQLSAFPAACPECDRGREALYYEIED
jgi:rubrerythrin